MHLVYLFNTTTMYVVSGSVRIKRAYEPKGTDPKTIDYTIYDQNGLGIEYQDRLRLANAKSKAYVRNDNDRTKG